MRHWSQLATRNWRAKPVRTLGALLAIALGTGAVVWVTCCYESVRRATEAWASGYVGKSSINIESPASRWDQIPQRMVPALRTLKEVKHLTVRLDQRLRAIGLTKGEQALGDESLLRSDKSTPEMDFLGIDLEHEFHVRAYEIAAGRMLSVSDGLTCMVETAYAKQKQLEVGDLVRVWSQDFNKPDDLEIVGMFERRRLNQFQKPRVLLQLHQLQELTLKHALVTSVDIVLHDASRAGVRAAARKIKPIARRYTPAVNITSAEVRLRQTDKAQEQLEYILTLLSSVSLLTALFVILSTLSMGMVERIAQLGLMRCLGVTRLQLAAIIFIEVLPLGMVGVVVGVPVGFALTQITVWMAPEYVGTFAISWSGVTLALVGGLVTTFVAATLPAIAALSVSPLEAARPRARTPKPILLASVALAAAVVFAAWYLSLGMVQRSHTFIQMAATTIILLYVGFALLGPLAVRFIGTVMVYAAAAVMGVRARLLQDQVGNAVWRSAGICCGLMVGLSMIVGLAVFNKSVRAAWEFPSHFPEAYVWGLEQMRPEADDVHEIVGKIDGIRKYAVCNAVNVFVEERPLFMAKVQHSITWFLGVDPDSFFDLMRLEFVDGDPAEAQRLLEEGGYILISKDFAVARNKKIDDRVRVILGGRDYYFKVAGVIESPAIDLAATYFQVQSEMRAAAVGSVVGTNADLKKIFSSSGSRL
ncbi:MAG: ABC transporter permease, partial [Planctomycetes bacterium]|nr:ABC transporter permease [Planctomycetota bacterium]